MVYTSDNGPWNLKGSEESKVKGNNNRRVGGCAAPLRGYKFQRLEGGMREPAVMWWPGRIPAGTECHEIAGTIDLLPTMAILTGAELPANKIDGKSIVPFIEGRKGAKSPHKVYFYRTKSRDVAEEHPDIVKRMTCLLVEHRADLQQNSRPCGRADK